MKKWEHFKALFRRTQKQATRTYAELASMGGKNNSDWALNVQSEDMDLFQNAWALTSRVRDLFKCNPLYISYRETLWSNILGSNGIMLRMTIKEQEDRIVHTPEKNFLDGFNERRDRVQEFWAKKTGLEFVRQQRMRFTGDNGSRIAQVKIGEPDVFANALIERKWLEWQRMEFCDVRGTRNYKTIRQLRLISAVRDGDFFLRMVKNPAVNKFGFALHMINAEWCDRFLNQTLPNGNVIRMGIEYQFESWGLGKPVAYHFIKRQPRDWQWSRMGGFNNLGSTHERISADEIIHYARATDADGTRPAPWVATTIPSSRQRDQAMLSEVIAWREAANKTGVYFSDVNPEGGMAAALPDPQSAVPTEQSSPGDKRGLPWGVKYQQNDPTHPNANVKEFRMASIQDGCAGMPGANYSTMANDYAAINFSAGRLQRLDTNETNMLLQDFEIEYGENKVFENWLYMALLTGQVPLPLAKFEKFNSKVFSGRRWAGVDEVKEAQASALRVANHQSNDFLECAARSLDFAEVIEGQAEANMIKEMFGITKTKTVESSPATATASDDAASAAENATIQGTGLNGAQIEALLSIINKVTTGEIEIETATALIAAAFPLMTSAEISAITAQLEVQEPDDTTEVETPVVSSAKKKALARRRQIT